MQKTIFINYRRADSEDFAGRLHDALSSDFNVFFDTEKINTGDIFPKRLKDGVKEADIFLMIIGEHFLEEFEKREPSDDFVRKEILFAKEFKCTIMPIVKKGVNFPDFFPEGLEFLAPIDAFSFGNNSFLMYINKLKEEIANISPKENRTFTKEVLEELKRERLVVLFSQELTPIEKYIQPIKAELKKAFPHRFYEVFVPSFEDNPKAYFGAIATDCCVDCTINKSSDWERGLRKMLQETSKPLVLYISNIEDGDEKLDREFASIIRNLKNDFVHFHALLTGHKRLAKLVEGNGKLSPLNTAKELFFPESHQQLTQEKIAQQFNRLGKYEEQICTYLQKESLGRFTVWSYNALVNELFWKNLLVKDGDRLVWRDELTKEIGREVFWCESK